MSHVIVRLHGGLAERMGASASLELDLPATVTLLDLQDRLGIPRGEAGLFLVGRQIRPESATVGDASEIDIYPVFGGG